MSKNIIISIISICCLCFTFSCSQDNEEQSTENISHQTRQSSLEEGKKKEPTLDETTASPVVRFYSIDESDTVTVSPGESQTAQAPLVLHLEAHISNPDNYKYICEWRLWSTQDGGSETNPMMTRFEENTLYTLKKSGGYGIKLYVMFTLDGDTIEYESEQINVVISESKLTCPDGFSPNDDGINDSLRITAQSIVELDARFFNRWGKEVHSVTLETAKRAEDEPNKLILWDGRSNGKIVADGVYYLRLDALGSDGVKYKIKKAINVLTGFLESESESGGGSSQ